MTESNETQRDVKRLKWHVENIDKKLDMMVRGDADVMEAIADVFRDDEMLCKVYLAVNGERTQQEIADEVGTSNATVSRKISTLSDHSLVWKKDYDDGIIYQKDELHETLRLDQKVTPDGWNDE
ncbi:DUF7343 domain-containing protein [Halosimplex marinum]|uniref:DUF7343 domain-containing protein n=1 Tax=Halosimplex marinum TaxID=3396620 RepID=UPI003F56FD3C